MSKIVRMRKTMIGPATCEAVAGVTIRPFNDPGDIESWLALREAAFAGLVATGRPWTSADFNREFAASRLRLAVTASRERQRPEEAVIGAIALGRAGRSPHDRPALQWLMVVPAERRRGVGRALIATVEQAAWEAGERELTLETHIEWREALRLYERCGYSAIQ